MTRSAEPVSKLAQRAMIGVCIFSFFIFADNQLVCRDIGTPNPSPLVDDGVLYMYTTEDPVGAGSIRNINHHCWTTTDLYHWHDSGVVLTEADVPWIDADRDHMWAPTVHKLGTGEYPYHLYWPGITRDGVAHVGHAKARRPTGPFIADSTWMRGCGDEALDPFVVDSGNGVYYICWDIVNITPNYVYLRKLNETFDDAIGTRHDITGGIGTSRDYKEGMWFIRQNNLWYLFYAHWPTSAERISYSTAANLTGPYTFRADLMNENTNSATIHPGICHCLDRWIMFWHCGGNELGGSITTNQKRVAGAEFFYFNTATTPWSINADDRIPKTLRGIGVPNAYHDTIQVDRSSAMSNATDTIVRGGEPLGWMVTRISDNGWVRYDTINFTPDSGYIGPTRVSLRVATSVATNSIAVRLGSRTGQLLAELDVPSTGGATTWMTMSDTITERVTGLQNVALVFSIPSGSNNLNVNWIRFGQTEARVGAAGEVLKPSRPAYRYKRINRSTSHLFFEGLAAPTLALFNLRGREVPGISTLQTGNRLEVRFDRTLSSGAYILKVDGIAGAEEIPVMY
ncbi:MAG: family 43 glycosylhydrolase [Chitinispirillaceae bacterium]|nr:family 43 glycosylhydrolase [Chitinispirillaceae bacterium]